MEALKKCSIIVSNDEVVNGPNNASSFSGLAQRENMKNVEVVVDSRKPHRAIKEEARYYEIMRRECFERFE